MFCVLSILYYTNTYSFVMFICYLHKYIVKLFGSCYYNYNILYGISEEDFYTYYRYISMYMFIKWLIIYIYMYTPVIYILYAHIYCKFRSN